MTTQLEITRNFLKEVGEIDNYNLNIWGSNQGWVGDSARKHANTLKNRIPQEVHHPKGNKHIWKWGAAPEEKKEYKYESNGQGLIL